MNPRSSTVHSDAISVRAPAKLNLHLAVGRRRADGFHPLTTVFHAISLYDDVTVRPAEEWSLRVHSSSGLDVDAVPTGPENLVARAGEVLARHHDRPLPAEVSIDKTIPIAAGLAGGSADAAAALVALDRLHDLQTPDDELLALAAELGSDVPFALIGGTALGTGRGEVLTPVEDDGGWWWVVIPSHEGLSTAEVYRAFDHLPLPATDDEPVRLEEPRDLIGGLYTGEVGALVDHLHNDLQAAADVIRPDLARARERVEELGAHRVMVSGSGPTLFVPLDHPDDARELAAAIAAADLADGRGAPEPLVCHGPVAGAHVLQTVVGEGHDG